MISPLMHVVLPGSGLSYHAHNLHPFSMKLLTGNLHLQGIFGYDEYLLVDYKDVRACDSSTVMTLVAFLGGEGGWCVS